MLTAQPTGLSAKYKGHNMPAITHKGSTYTTSTALHALYTSAGKNLQASYTPAGWARVVLAATRQAVTPASVKRTGMAYRGQLWRNSGNGVGRGNAYPPLTGAQVQAAIVQAATLTGSKLHTAQGKVLAQARKAAGGAARSAKANAKAKPPKVVGAAKPAPASAPAPVVVAAP